MPAGDGSGHECPEPRRAEREHPRRNSTAYTYDPLNRQTQKALPGGETLAYGYDDVGNMTSLTDGGGEIDYAYNDVNLLTTLTEPGGAQTTFTYDSNNRRLTTAFPNGVTETRTYDDSGRLASVGGKDAGGTVLTSSAYTYTDAGSQDAALVQTLTDTLGNVTTYSYDALNRLTRAQRGGTDPSDFQYAYDGAGNRTTQTANGTPISYTSNAANELTAAGSTTYTYDANGNETGNSAGLAFAYNAKNQTTSVTPPGGAALAMSYSGATQAARRLRQQHAGQRAAGAASRERQ
ncbi:MAG TPA: hypothetical protein VFW96_27000 [Thermomicrobiales bacterium]|nr:hypothetical protein [Thermomicrobiales bacterium]